MISIVRYALFAFAAFLIVGGILGFAEKHSVMSLIGGGVCALVAVVGALQLAKNPRFGLMLGFVSALIASGRPLSKLSDGVKLWPGGALLAASAVVAALCLYAYLTSPKK